MYFERTEDLLQPVHTLLLKFTHELPNLDKRETNPQIL